MDCGSCGTWVCDGAGGLTCDDPGANICGGCGVITGTIGDACGRCDADELACEGGDLVCDGDTAENACGGCRSLSATPGTFCRSGSCPGGFGTVTCTGPENVTCDCDGERCGNGVLEDDEECDDGNTTGGDGCNVTCELEAIAGSPVGTCADPIPVIFDSQETWDLCGAGDELDNIAGDVDCIDATSRGEDLVFTFTLTETQRVAVDVRDDDDGAAIDVVAYIRSDCDDASTQAICGDDVGCFDSDVTVGSCIGSRQPRQGRFDTTLPPGTWYLIVDQYNYSRGGTTFSCGDVLVKIED